MTLEEERVWNVLVQSGQSRGAEYQEESKEARRQAVLAADLELKSSRERIRELEEALKGTMLDQDCWCDAAVDGHDQWCIAARKALNIETNPT